MISNVGANTKALFRRAYSVAIGPPGQTAVLQYANFPSLNAKGELQPPSGIRIQFDIDKNMIGTSNKAKISLFNLQPQTRQWVKKGFLVQLRAGYNGLIHTLFTGNVLLNGVKSERSGSEVVLHLECGDGESSITLMRFDKSYPPGITLVKILEDMATAMATETVYNPQGTNIGVVVALPNVTYGRGISFHGPVRGSLDKLLKPQGLRWSIQNGNIVIFPVGSNNQQQAIVISEDTGMIGVPSQNDNYVEFVSLLNPSIQPGSLIQLISTNNTSVNGFYNVMRAHYEGDTHDNKWQVSCQAAPAKNITIQQPTSAGGNLGNAVMA